MLEQKNVIQVLMCVYDKSGTYSRHAGVVISSLFTNTKSPVNVTIFHDDTLTDDNRRRFERTGERFEQGVSFVDVGTHISRVADNPDKVGRHFSRGALFRLLAPDLMSVPKVIYLDCDIVVNMDIAELWGVDMGGVSCGAVLNGIIVDISSNRKALERRRRHVLKYTQTTYFNSGVLIMNLDKIHKHHNIARESCEFLLKHQDIVIWPDQDFLNVCFANDVAYLNERFNCFPSRLPSSLCNTIIHFIGAKPWEHFPCTLAEALYWKYFLTSEWSDQMLNALAECVPCKDKPNPPFPVDHVPPGASIVLYGAGGLGCAWYSALKLIKYCRVSLWVDKRADEFGPPVKSVSKIKRAKYDYIVISVSSRKVAREIADDLISSYGVKPEKIVFTKIRRLIDHAGAK